MNAFVTPQEVTAAASAVRERSQRQPAVGLVLGSGLSSLADAVSEADIVNSQDIPYWPTSTVSGHTGRLLLGTLEGKDVLVLQGRSHFYEGHSIGRITLPVHVMQALGVRTLIVTNAAGGINASYTPGDLMLIRDHLNFLGMAGHNPLRGPNNDQVGVRFPDMTEPYNAGLRRLAQRVAENEGFAVQEGVYAYVAGPSYETPAELRFLRMAGADAVGMSTVPSVIVARHANMRVLGVSTITNMAVPDPAPGTELTHAEVLETGKQVIPRLTALIRGMLRAL